jgi:hypothetical protein
MSYCRWSSDNFMCDVYVYEAVYGGWTTHVAGNKSIFPPIPELPFWWLPNLEGKFDRDSRRMRYPNRWRAALAHIVCSVWALSSRLHLWSLELIPRRAIGLPHDGATFDDPSPGECADRLESLRAMGYRVPSRAIAALRSEQSDMNCEVPA